MIPCTKIINRKTNIHNQNQAGPLFVWNITTQCNLSCSHCYRDSGMIRPVLQLSDEKCMQLIDEIKQLHPPIVLFTGGEPLLRKNLFELIRKCKLSGLRVGLSTNGTIIDQDIAGRIKNYDIDYVGISIDGRRSFHDEFRGLKGAFSLSWTAIDHLLSLKVKTGVRFTLTRENQGELLYVLDKAFRSGVKRFCLYHLVYSGRAGLDMDLSAEEKRDFMERFFKIIKTMSSLDEEFQVLTTDNPVDGVYMSKYLIDEALAPEYLKSQSGCSAGKNIVYLDSTGEVYPCQFLRGESLGNAMESSLLDIWSNGHNELLQRLRSKGNFLQGRCGRCIYKEMCSGCRCRAKAYTGCLWGADPACYLQENEIEDAANY
jgi:radical SAM protein with 4Fe4S-binding SPASM domain